MAIGIKDRSFPKYPVGAIHWAAFSLTEKQRDRCLRSEKRRRTEPPGKVAMLGEVEGVGFLKCLCVF
ncbi:hypothetical protein L484_018705 [Morus notabilis]|uniref:Uncharacterized protein n=1 Tax=Morus notabilis TaxID=981085 RepID=W9S5C8_9ROSA|nr:hypothetical protein L484_018705 [Morus notabilis]